MRRGPGQQGGAAGEYHYVDVHGAGAQRSDPKAGDPAMFPHGRGPQGDVIRIYNYVRLVRGGGVVKRTEAASAASAPTAPTRAEEPGAFPLGPGTGGPGGFHLLPARAREQLNLSPDQQKQLSDLEAEAQARLEQILTPEQFGRLKELRQPQGPGGRGGGPGGPGGRGGPGSEGLP